MADTSSSKDDLAQQVRRTLESGDVVTFGELLNANVRWGVAGNPSPTCQNHRRVLNWYERGRSPGTTAKVSTIFVLGARLLVELVIRGNDESYQRRGQAIRWQLLSARDGRIAETVGFDRRDEAESYAQTASD